MTQKELSEHLERTYTAVGAWESGKNTPPVNSLIQMCKLFNVQIGDMIFKNMEHEEYSTVEEAPEDYRNVKEELLELMRYKIALYEKEIKENAPELAKKLNIKD